MQNKETIKKAVDILINGGGLIAPTETAYGFVCDATNKEAIDKIYKIKKREKNKFLPLAVASLAQMQDYFELNKKELDLSKKHPGLSLVVRPRVREQVNNVFLFKDQKDCAVRISTNNLIQSIARKLGRPLTVSSANLAGEDVCYSVPEIKKQIGDLESKVDMILDNGRLKVKKPSTIVRVCGDGVEILRQGEIEI
ncbi:threonylcarbamoyl-AMP synthase [Candidatus Kuenenbacteria bacterium CG1_02_38_13]|uniref:L-threonylcarbamoyladenylate synthase n=1 Tax=Candidatus Kuenenbacteria bacterium CG1_02_38_13 TaxID=1805235 RepID=A0A1J4U2H1_9BACT|nr:MAG: threonylcarbamoyl-AMP synthase [Candidatus Kuenenbacteria bacterium CG1_02_38_13]